MTHATIRHCPNTPVILDHTEEAVIALLGWDVQVEVEDGAPGEFSVLVDDEVVLTADVSHLPPADDVVAAVNAVGEASLAV